MSSTWAAGIPVASISAGTRVTIASTFAAKPQLGHFTYVSSPLSQVANLTLLDPTPPSITLADGVTQRQLTHLFESNNVVANVKLFYTLGPVTVQGAWNHLSPQLFSVSTTDRLQDRVFAAIDIFDAQVRFELSRNVTIVAQGKNLTNSRPRRMFGPNFGLLREELDNGSAYYIGALVRF